MKEWLFTLQHKASGHQKQFLFDNENAAKEAMAIAKTGHVFSHKAGLSSIDPESYCEWTVGSAQSVFDQLQWFNYGNTMAQTRGHHQVQKEIQAEHEANERAKAASNPTPVPLSAVQ